MGGVIVTSNVLVSGAVDLHSKRGIFL